MSKAMIKIPSVITTSRTEETEAIGASLASLLASDPTLPRFIALYGDLGVGKTAFVRGFTSTLAPGARVKSPTFALVHEYGAQPHPVFHFDMYRITDEDELYSIGFYDYFSRGGYILTEWSENIDFALPESYLQVKIEKTCVNTPDERRITIDILHA